MIFRNRVRAVWSGLVCVLYTTIIIIVNNFDKFFDALNVSNFTNSIHTLNLSKWPTKVVTTFV